VVPLSQLQVLVVDCQATAAAPVGHLLEIGWARIGATAPLTQARLVALVDGVPIPPAVVRITGISERMARNGIDPHSVWRERAREAATLPRQPAPTIIHFARFEQPFLRSLTSGPLPFDIVCAHEVARRLLPDMPRRPVTGDRGRHDPRSLSRRSRAT
jgi:DNA polymerase III subunit epsilon